MLAPNEEVSEGVASASAKGRLLHMPLHVGSGVDRLPLAVSRQPGVARICRHECGYDQVEPPRRSRLNG